MKRILFTLAAAAASVFLCAQTDTVRYREVVVTGTRNAVDIRHLPMTVTVVGRETLTAQEQTSVLPTLMQQVPGLTVTSRGMMGYGVSTGAAGGINLRGLTGGSGQLLVLIDGHPQYNGVYGHPISDSYQTLMTDRVEVLRGPASVLYGSNAMGGVVNIVTRGMHSDGTKTDVNVGIGSYGTVQTEASNQVRSGRFSSTVAAQYGRTDNHRPHMGFEQYAGYGKVAYDFNENLRAYLDADLTHFNSQYPGSTSNPIYGADQWITRGVVSAALENRFERTSGAVSVYSNFGRHKIDDGSSDPAAPSLRYFRSKDALTGISLYQSAQLFEGNRLTLGFDFQHIYGNAYYTSKSTGEILVTPNKQSGKAYRNEVAAYVDVRQDLATWMTLDAGLRFDHHSVCGTEWIPQIGLVVRPISAGELKAMVSKGFRVPSMREMYLYPPSNEDLKPERIWNYELSWHQRFEHFRYGVNLFYLKGDNMVQTVNFKNVNTGEVENCGVEIEAAYRFSPSLSLTTNHALLHMEHPVIAAPRYKGFLGADYQHYRWHLIGGLQYVSGLYTAVGNNAQKENFCLLNLTVNYQLLKQMRLWVRGENLLAQRYELQLGYPLPRATFMAGVHLSF